MGWNCRLAAHRAGVAARGRVAAAGAGGGGAAAGIGTPEQFLKAATDPLRLNKLGIPGNSPEGYLFPDTYAFARGVTPRQIVEGMVHRFREAYAAAAAARSPEVTLDEAEAVNSYVPELRRRGVRAARSSAATCCSGRPGAGSPPAASRPGSARWRLRARR